MKKALNLIVSVYVLVFCHVDTIHAQSKTAISPEPTAISRFYFVSEQNVHLMLGITDQTNSAIMFQKDNAMAREFMMGSLKAITDSIEKHSEITFLPIDHLKGKVTYSRMGLPLASAKKAAKKAGQAQYVSIDVSVQGAKTITTSGSIDAFWGSNMPIDNVQEIMDSLNIAIEETSTEQRFFPEIQVTMKFADRDGNVIEKLKGIYTHPERLAITTESNDLTLFGSKGGTTSISLEQDIYADQIPYYLFLGRAVKNLIRQL